MSSRWRLLCPPRPCVSLCSSSSARTALAIDAGDIFAGRGNVTVNGTSAARVAGSLVLSLPEEALAEATKVPALEKALPHYAVRMHGGGQARGCDRGAGFAWPPISPLKSRAAPMKTSAAAIWLWTFCKTSGLAPGGSKANIQNLRFRDMGAVYAPILPLNADRTGFYRHRPRWRRGQALKPFLGCQTGARPFVSAEEVSYRPDLKKPS